MARWVVTSIKTNADFMILGGIQNPHSMTVLRQLDREKIQKSLSKC
jgi:hypothetical protein